MFTNYELELEKNKHNTNSEILDPIVNMLVSFSHASPNQSTVHSTLQPVGFFVQQYVVICTYIEVLHTYKYICTIVHVGKYTIERRFGATAH